MFDQGQAQPAAFDVMHKTRADAIKTLENPPVLFFRDTNALVDDGNRAILLPATKANPDRSGLPRILAGVIQQIRHRLGNGRTGQPRRGIRESFGALWLLLQRTAS
jgi:hypothetical protein